MMEWINVKDKLPQEKENILSYRHYDGWIVICYYNENRRFMLEPDTEAYLITHWMPLPNPPESNS
jgi:hypothetical protein